MIRGYNLTIITITITLSTNSCTYQYSQTASLSTIMTPFTTTSTTTTAKITTVTAMCSFSDNQAGNTMHKKQYRSPNYYVTPQTHSKFVKTL